MGKMIVLKEMVLFSKNASAYERIYFFCVTQTTDQNLNGKIPECVW